MRQALIRLRAHRSERGASAVEYALVMGMIALVIIVSVTLFGGSTASLFSRTCSSIPAHLSSCS